MKKKVINPNEIVDTIDRFRHIFKGSDYKINYLGENVNEIVMETHSIVSMDDIWQVEKGTPFRLDKFNTKNGRTVMYFIREVEQK